MRTGPLTGQLIRIREIAACRFAQGTKSKTSTRKEMDGSDEEKRARSSTHYLVSWYSRGEVSHPVTSLFLHT